MRTNISYAQTFALKSVSAKDELSKNRFHLNKIILIALLDTIFTFDRII